jgi:hypothetical protein
METEALGAKTPGVPAVPCTVLRKCRACGERAYHPFRPVTHRQQRSAFISCVNCGAQWLGKIRCTEFSLELLMALRRFN